MNREALVAARERLRPYVERAKTITGTRIATRAGSGLWTMSKCLQTSSE